MENIAKLHNAQAYSSESLIRIMPNLDQLLKARKIYAIAFSKSGEEVLKDNIESINNNIKELLSI